MQRESSFDFEFSDLLGNQKGGTEKVKRIGDDNFHLERFLPLIPETWNEKIGSHQNNGE
jgi:hypothetical protein